MASRLRCLLRRHIRLLKNFRSSGLVSENALNWAIRDRRSGSLLLVVSLRCSCAIPLTLSVHSLQFPSPSSFSVSLAFSVQLSPGCQFRRLLGFFVNLGLYPHKILFVNSAHTGLWSVAACVYWSIQVSWRYQSCDAMMKSICAFCPSLQAWRVHINSGCSVFCHVLQAIRLCSSINSTSSACLSFSCTERILPGLSITASPIRSLSLTPARLTLQSIPSKIAPLGRFSKKPCTSDNVSWKSLILQPLCGKCIERIVAVSHNETASHLVPPSR